jgi:hypothetical protein
MLKGKPTSWAALGVASAGSVARKARRSTTSCNDAFV